MATVSFDIPDGYTAYVTAIPNGEGAQLVEAVCSIYNYTGSDPDPQNEGETLTANQFAHQKLIDLMYLQVKTIQGQQAAAAARASAVAAVSENLHILRIDEPIG
jgi:hypothetical protein